MTRTLKGAAPMSDTITVIDDGHPVTLSFDAINAYHGGSFPDGVAHALKAMQAAFPMLSNTLVERREIEIVTAYDGPGGRDALEAVTRALTEGRLTIDPSLGTADPITDPPGPYVFRFTYRGRSVEARVKPGHIRPDFALLNGWTQKTADDIARHEELKAEMANRLLGLHAGVVYAVRRL